MRTCLRTYTCPYTLLTCVLTHVPARTQGGLCGIQEDHAVQASGGGQCDRVGRLQSTVYYLQGGGDGSGGDGSGGGGGGGGGNVPPERMAALGAPHDARAHLKGRCLPATIAGLART